MMGRIIFLLEEPSMKILLDDLLPRLLPGWVENQHFQCVPHDGKSDLDRSIPIKLRSWREPGVRFVIVRDNDGADCAALKAQLQAMCTENERSDTLVRLVCQELESWYIGDLKALANAFNNPKLDTPALRKRYSDPDSWLKPSVEVEKLISTFQKRNGARMMATYLSEANNLSRSFQVFINGVRKIASEMGYKSIIN